jgi:hypothetical protein
VRRQSGQATERGAAKRTLAMIAMATLVWLVAGLLAYGVTKMLI